jgi:hypothetical protein
MRGRLGLEELRGLRGRERQKKRRSGEAQDRVRGWVRDRREREKHGTEEMKHIEEVESGLQEELYNIIFDDRK